MIKMIFYTLLTYYPDIDRVNVVLTSLILYIMIYIGVPEEQEELKMPILAAFVAADLIMLYHEYSIKWLGMKFKFVRQKFKFVRKMFKHVKRTVLEGFAYVKKWIMEEEKQNKKQKREKKSDHERKKSKKKKSVRFSPVNQYHEYQTMSSMPMPTAQLQSWQLTPRQRLEQQLLSKKYQEQLALASTPMIDNRHLTAGMDSGNYLKSYDETDDSDQSSDLSNSEEGFDF
jgi:hypothetical protein